MSEAQAMANVLMIDEDFVNTPGKGAGGFRFDGD
jgi:hypothetical protein